MERIRWAFAVLIAGLVTACSEEEVRELPPPAELTREAIGHYCQMIVMDHVGPKGQLFLAERSEPVWFSSVRDTIAFTMLPEEPKSVVAIYVNDMGDTDWDSPGRDTWIDAKTATYVIGSTRRGGMGAPEAVPFSKREDAQRFAAENGGEILSFEEISPDVILSAVDDALDDQTMSQDESSHDHQGQHAEAGGEHAASSGHADGEPGGEHQ